MPPMRSVDPNIPQAVSDVVSRCTALDPEGRTRRRKNSSRISRVSTSTGIRRTARRLTRRTPGRSLCRHTGFLDILTRDRCTRDDVPGQTFPGQTMPGQTLPGQTVPFPGGTAQPPARRLWLLVAASVVGLAIGTGAFLYRDRLFGGGGAAVATREVSIVILPFRNASGDRSLDYLGQTIAEQLRTQIGQSRALRAVSSATIGQILSDLRISQDTRFDPNRTKEIASLTKADVVIVGEYGKFGSRIQITANMQDLPRGTEDTVPEMAENETVLLASIERLAEALRGKLALAPDDLKAATAASYRPSSKSLPALQKYNEGIALLREGKLNDAVKAFQASTAEDKEFALAFARLAQTYAALGMPSEADRHARTSERLSGALPDVEKYMVLANYARIMKNRAEAVGFYDKLATLLPGSDEVLTDLAAALEDNWDFDRAHAEYTKLATRDPENLEAWIGIGRVEVKRDQSQAALDPLGKALNIAIKRDNLEGQATARMWVGVAHRIQNKTDLALNEFALAQKIARQLDRKRMVAEIILETGKVQANLGKFDVALKLYNESMALRRDMKDQQAIGDALIDFGNAYGNTGRLDQALASFNESLGIQRDQKNYNYERVVLSNIGAVHTIRNEHQTALTFYQNALAAGEKINNPGYQANALYNIGETQTRLGRFAEAEKSLIQAITLRRQANDARGIAQVQSSLAKLMGYQARFEPARTTAKDAYDVIERTKEETDWTIIHRAEYGAALGNLGEIAEATKVLDSAAALARKLQIPPLLADVLNYQGDLFFRQGDFKQARTQYEQALQAATTSQDPQRILLSRLHLAITSVKEGRPVAGGELQKLAGEADRWGFKAESVSASIALGESLIAAKQYRQAQGELENAMSSSQRIGLRVQLAQSHYWLSRALEGAGDAAAARQQLQDAQRVLDLIKAEAKNDAFLKRADLAPIAAAK